MNTFFIAKYFFFLFLSTLGLEPGISHKKNLDSTIFKYDRRRHKKNEVLFIIRIHYIK